MWVKAKEGPQVRRWKRGRHGGVCIHNASFPMCALMFACMWQSGRRPSLGENLFKDVCEYSGQLLSEDLSLCSLHLRVHTDLHRHPLCSVGWQDIQSHHTGILFLSNHWVSGLFTPCIQIQAKRKNRRRSEGCVDWGNCISIMDVGLNKTLGLLGRNRGGSKLVSPSLSGLFYNNLFVFLFFFYVYRERTQICTYSEDLNNNISYCCFNYSQGNDFCGLRSKRAKIVQKHQFFLLQDFYI